MLLTLCTLLTTSLSAEGCGCHKTEPTTTNTQHHGKHIGQQELTFVVPSPQCEKFKDSSGRHANITIAAAYRHDAAEKGVKEKKIHVSDATIATKDGKTTVHFFVSKKANPAEVEKKVREGFEKLCADEKTHLAKPEKNREGINCWFCHKCDVYMKWAKIKWENIKQKFSAKTPAPKK